ncbi:hypothetical protein H0H93_009963 [Arthromyces matolae]|nr:hypothetical protein H0H93_009963 [Arthromyces matolae]
MSPKETFSLPGNGLSPASIRTEFSSNEDDEISTSDTRTAIDSDRSTIRTEKSSIPAAIYTHHEDSSNDLVGWNGPDDPGNPRNWSVRRRWVVTLVVSLFTFISKDPSFPSSKNYLLTLSSVFNTLCGFAKTPTQILVFRFLAGFGGVAPQTLGGGVVGDLWSPEERGMAMSIYSLAPLVGPSTGPLVGGWIAERSTWQWTFWSVSIADALLQIVGFIFLRETYPPELLKQKARAMRKETGNQKLRSTFERPDRHWTTVMVRGMIKPLVFLATEPIVQVFALYMAVLYGVLYLSLTSTPFPPSR